jgi:branched-chain amino acid transport system substrate-binding protein
VMTYSIATDGSNLTPKTQPFVDAYTKRFGEPPPYTGFNSFDAIYVLADAIKRAGSTDADKLVAALEKTEVEGTVGRIEFYGRDNPYTHAMKYGPNYVTSISLQWQDGKQVTLWPKADKGAKVEFPAFTHLQRK